MGEAMVTGSFAEMQANSGAGLAKSWLRVEAVLVVDVSSSMETKDAGNFERRVDVARREVAKLQRRMPGKLAIVAFNYDASWDPAGKLPEPCGSTNVAGALEYVRDLLGPGAQGLKVVVISDGEPDSAEAALAEAALLKAAGATISTVYCGPDHGHGKGFLNRLASTGGGDLADAELVKALADAVQKLLTA
jgi:Mg-chelatase subunit ChlD